MRYAVDRTTLEGDADAVEAVLRRLERLSPDDDVENLARAVPGGDTARVAGSVAQQWRERLVDVRRQLRGWGAALAAASQMYARVESVARSALVEARTRGGE